MTVRASALLIAFVLAVSGPAAAQGIEELVRLDRLARLRESVEVGSISSYDPTGGNDDGFSGKYSFVRREGDGLVLADLQGPGIIYRVWTPTPTDDPLEFYFDGEATPRLKLPFVDLFTGSRPPFVTPLVGHGAGGFYSYVPVSFRQSCKIVARPGPGRAQAKIQFYQINYAKYPAFLGLQSFSATLASVDADQLEHARQLVSLAGSDLSSFIAPPDDRTLTARVTGRLEPGQTVALLNADHGGRIVGLRLGPASAFGGKDRAVVLRMYWDDDPVPAVSVPVSDFFGYSWGDPATTALLLGTAMDVNYTYLPMPFDRSARIELVSEAAPTAAPIDFQAEIVRADEARRSDEGHFYAVWRRENPTAAGVPFTFLDVKGRGHIVAALLQAQGTEPGSTEFFEGDDEATLDGRVTIRGTGSEDAFNGGWYDVPGRWDARVSLPFSGSLDYKKHLARTGAYRFFLTDAYAFRKSARLTIEHGPEGNRIPTDYVGVTFLYALGRPEGLPELPAVAMRRVADPVRIVFAAGWSVPVQAFSFRSATLAKRTEKIDGKEVRYLSMTAEGEDIFGPHFVSLLCEIPRAGRYKISVEAIDGPGQAIVQLFRNERPVGNTADFYAPDRQASRVVSMGPLELREGLNPIFFKLVGKNSLSSGLGFDLVRIICERVAD